MAQKTPGFDSARFRQLAGYSKYTRETYERNIRVIPGYDLLHKCLVEEVGAYAKEKKRKEDPDLTPITLCELGVGTGHSSELVLKKIAETHGGLHSFLGIECLEGMYRTAVRRLVCRYNAALLCADYFGFVAEEANGSVRRQFDIVFSAISVHHVVDEVKAELVSNVFRLLRQGGIFILGDLMTFADKAKAEAAAKASEAHLMANAGSEKIAEEWLTHWRELNILGTVEEHIKWFGEAGFANVRYVFEELTTNMIVGEKPVV